MSGATLTVENLSKRFESIQALDAVSAEFVPGQIAAVLGENGAGKSTLVKALAGFVKPDAGLIRLNGDPLPLGDPVALRSKGIEMVHQHFMLVPQLTVSENLALARMVCLNGRLDVNRIAAPALQLASELGWDINPGSRAGDLPVGAQQRVEIVKALSGGAAVLIFDEPTAVLSPAETQDLFRVLRDLKARGKTVILIAHKLSEVMRIADRAIVLRRGRKVAEASIADVTEETLANWMVGALPLRTQSAREIEGPVTIRCEGLLVLGDRGQQAVGDATFEIRRGETVGFGGVDGNGQVELAEVLAGIRAFQGGSLTPQPGCRNIAYIPQDRLQDGLALRMSILENLTIAGQSLADLSVGPFLAPKRLRRWAKELVAAFDIKIEGLDGPVAALSGGNQQKIVVSRNLSRLPDLLVAVNPTRGLDIRAAEYVQQKILESARAGAAVALFSTDLDELAMLASRTLFMSRGTLSDQQSAEALVGA